MRANLSGIVSHGAIQRRTQRAREVQGKQIGACSKRAAQKIVAKLKPGLPASILAKLDHNEGYVVPRWALAPGGDTIENTLLHFRKGSLTWSGISSVLLRIVSSISAMENICSGNRLEPNRPFLVVSGLH